MLLECLESKINRVKVMLLEKPVMPATVMPKIPPAPILQKSLPIYTPSQEYVDVSNNYTTSINRCYDEIKRLENILSSQVRADRRKRTANAFLYSLANPKQKLSTDYIRNSNKRIQEIQKQISSLESIKKVRLEERCQQMFRR
jgi:hypothetical protein